MFSFFFQRNMNSKLYLFWFFSVPPTFQEFPYEGSGEIDLDSPKVIVNQSLTLYCPATADPPPDIIWLKDGKEITPRELGKRIIISADKKSLLIKSATIEDTARFMCVASNVAGELDRTFDVQVQGNFFLN